MTEPARTRREPPEPPSGAAGASPGPRPPGEDRPEADLVARAAGDSAAFAELYRRNYDAVAAHVWRRTGDVHATEDLTAEVFHIALARIGRYRPTGAPLRFWLLRIAANAVHRWARKRRRGEDALALRARDDVGPTGEGGSDGGPDEERVRCALASLPARYQAALVLHYLDGLPIAEVAALLGVRVGTVKSRLARGREALRRHLEGDETR